MINERKKLILEIDKTLWNDIRRVAGNRRRSIRGQIEKILIDYIDELTMFDRDEKKDR